MAHEVFEDRVIVRGTPAWHRLGQVFGADEALAVEDGFRRAKLDIEIVKLPMYAELPDGGRIVVEGRRALTRLASHGSGPELIADVDANYPYFSNMEIARMVGDLSRAAGWPLETAGALKAGELIFVTLRAGRHLVAGSDPVDDFFLFSDWRNGEAPADLGYVPRRVVCANTLNWSLANATTRVRIRHDHSTFKADVQWTMNVLARLRGIQLRAWDLFDAIAARAVSADERRALWQRVYAEPARPEQSDLVREAEAAGHDVSDLVARLGAKRRDWERERDELALRRRDVEVLHERLAPEFERVGLAGTGWHAYQACTEYEDTRVGQGRTAGALRRSAASAVFGDRADTKARAFAALSELVGAGAPATA